MTDERDQLKDELRVLNGRIQVERNEEVRHALRRNGLEAERTQLLVRLMEAHVLPSDRLRTRLAVAAPVAPAADAPEMNGAHVPPEVMAKPASEKRKVKPDGLPSIPQMVLGALEDSEKGLSSGEIIVFVRQKWWPDVPAMRVYAIISKMAKEGKIAKKRGRYSAVMPRLVMPADDVTVSA